MDQRTQTISGTALIVVSSLVVLLYAIPIPAFDVIPGVVGLVAALVMSAGTLMVGTSAGGV